MRAWIRSLLKVRDTPEALARGLAVGFFFGVSFLWGLQIALAVLFSYLLRGNKVVAAAMTAVSNPLTSLPLYGLCYFVGHLLLGGEDSLPDFAVVHTVQGFWALGPHFFLTMLVGTTLVGLLGAVVVYASSNRILEALRRWHDRRHAIAPKTMTRRRVRRRSEQPSDIAGAMAMPSSWPVFGESLTSVNDFPEAPETVPRILAQHRGNGHGHA